MIKKFERIISTTQSKFKALIEKKNITQQCSYNLPNEMESYLKGINALKRITPLGSEINVLYELVDDYKVVLGNNIIAIIGSSYSSSSNKAIFTHTEGPTGGSQKFQLKKTDFASHGAEFKWFVELYEKNIESVNFVAFVDDVNKKIKFDIELSPELFSGESINDEDDVVAKIDRFTPEWFNEKGKEFIAEDEEAKEMYKSFIEKYGVDKIGALSGENLLNYLFLGGNADNLCHELEYVKRNTELFGSVKSGTAFKYPLFKRNGTWMTGTSHNPQELTLEEAIIKGTSVRDGLVLGVKAIKESLPLNTVEDYLSLYTKLYALIPELVDSLWVVKYFHMLFPELLPVFYNKDWQEKVLLVLKKEPNDAAYGRLGQINVFVKECDISNVVFGKVFHKYCRNIEVTNEDEDSFDDEVVERICGGTNIILYGVPGAGKSWTVKHEYCDENTKMERVVFHPDYTYSDFVGQILPQSVNGDVSYEFMPGPFTKILKNAIWDGKTKYVLVIEEINRGNAPAIFGDIFQLLDRDEQGNSEYKINNADIAKIVYGKENSQIYLPSNLSIICTMNTSDQNVFTLDTAFQRRWNMRLIENSFKKDTKEDKEFARHKVLDTSISWEDFCEAINNQILEKNQNMTSSEDKRLGTHFVTLDDLNYYDLEKAKDDKEKKEFALKNRRFPEKVIKYLWDDAFKFYRDEIFKGEYNSLEKVIKTFITNTKDERFQIFKENIKSSLDEVSKKNSTEE